MMGWFIVGWFVGDGVVYVGSFVGDRVVHSGMVCG